jgi:hypothetical protein
VEAAQAVPWTKPQDLPFDPSKPLSELSGLFPGGGNAVFCDGTVHFTSNKVKPEILKALITRNGGEILPESPPPRRDQGP